MLNECSVSIVHFIDPNTKLSIPSLCHLILPNVPSNLMIVYQKNLLRLLKSCGVFRKMGLKDGTLRIIAEYMSDNGDGEFSLEYESKPQSIYNPECYCAIKKIVLSKHFVSVNIEENGDTSLGSIQPPTDSRLRSNAESTETVKVEYVSFSEYDIGTKVHGVMTFKFSNLYKSLLNEILAIEFKYGIHPHGGYKWVPLFDSSNETHKKFVEEYLEYYSSKS